MAIRDGGVVVLLVMVIDNVWAVGRVGGVVVEGGGIHGESDQGSENERRVYRAVGRRMITSLQARSESCGLSPRFIHAVERLQLRTDSLPVIRFSASVTSRRVKIMAAKKGRVPRRFYRISCCF